jgi:phosphoglycolate phosphatase-like HAD superfamily hydrolase
VNVAPADAERGFAHVAWDFDGVLGDTRQIAWRAAEDILRPLGTCIAIDSQECFREHMIRGGTVAPEETTALRSMHRLIMRSKASEIPLFAAVEILDRLKVQSELVTSGLAEVARIALKDKAARFWRIRGSETGTKGDLLDGLPPNSLFITDTTVDVRRASQRGIATVAACWGYDSESALKREDPTYLASSSKDLVSLLTELGLLN